MQHYSQTERRDQPKVDDLSPVDAQMAAVLAKIARMNKALPGRAAPTSGLIRAFAGAPGVGKTACLSKWLARDALAHGYDVSVCRLDCEAADSTDALAVLCESLGIRISRSWEAAGRLQHDQAQFIDLPGINCDDNSRLRAMAARFSALEHVEVYLVLNAAYHVEVLANQARAFSILPISGLILSHVDEVEGTGHWKDILPCIQGMDCPVRFLSSGRDVPGIFQPPPAEMQTHGCHQGLAEPCLRDSSGRSFADMGRYL